MKRVPGFIWVAILALIPLLIQWLNGEYFAGQAWVSFAAIALSFIASLIKAYREMEEQKSVVSRSMITEDTPKVTFPYRTFFLG